MRNLMTLLLLFSLKIAAATGFGTVKGMVTYKNTPVAGASVYVKNTSKGVATDFDGLYSITLPKGKHTLYIQALGYKEKTIEIEVLEQKTKTYNVALEEHALSLDQVVITGTRTAKRKTKSPVIVNVISSETLEEVQACNLAEGLKFQTGLRVETDCQTCNYTQLRINGLAGGYSQIVINGRPVFSPLTGLYGLEQIPANMIERIEVVRGGGSALYGSSAIAGTVNVITKIPKKDDYSLQYTYQNIKADAQDHIFNANATVVNDLKNAGATFFVSKRHREMFDANHDNFSELPELKNNSFGINAFVLPDENQKIELNLSSMHEYRYGGEMTDKTTHFALQAEERTHDVLVGGLDYQINFNEDNSSFITYLSGQRTNRDHYTGIYPDDAQEIENHIENPPYGNSTATTLQAGMQINHRVTDFLNGKNTFTLGTEYIYDKVYDQITAYNYLIDQKTKNLGIFLQSDWEITPSLNLLTGIRADKHNLLDNFVFSPRVSLLYKHQQNWQFRATYGTGFRAPQAFDADLHMAFAGGGISRISLSPELKQERSNSFSASINYDKAFDTFIYGFTLEGFYTQLQDAFYQHPLGEDAFGETFEKRNGDGAKVQGATLELRANYNKKAQLETGITLQSSKYDTAISYSDALPNKRDFLRTPNLYGFATFSYTPNTKFKAAVNMVHTAAMDVLHLAGAPEQATDAFVKTAAFTEVNTKVGYTFTVPNLKTKVEVFTGVKNLLDAYQNDFDTLKDRDSNYVYGPSAPRTYFVGLTLKGF